MPNLDNIDAFFRYVSQRLGLKPDYRWSFDEANRPDLYAAMRAAVADEVVIDRKIVEQMRDQIFAELVHEYKNLDLDRRPIPVFNPFSKRSG